MTRTSAIRTALAALLAVWGTGMASAEVIPVEIRQSDNGWQLYRGGEPYLIRGAGGSGPMDRLAAAGANSVRTWSVDGAGDILDEAHRHGLTVTVGIWLGHERHGFDYDDPEQVTAQLEAARSAVLKHRDHPALLIWGVGNEAEGFEDGGDPAIWSAINEVAAMIKELDPHHPTMAVTAEVGGERIRKLHDDSPAIDIHGINSYGGALSVAERLRDGGGKKPYVITEFGPVGPWEMPTTEWGAPYEQTSSQKADFYRQSYEAAVINSKGQSLGSYAFLWGAKMEGTATWFGMTLDSGASLGALDTMTELWTGTAPDDLAPQIGPLQLKGDAKVEPGDTVRATTSVSDPEGSSVTVDWVLRPESGEYLTGGDYRPQLPDVEGAVVESDNGGAAVRMPEDPGPYRLFAYAYDESGNAATANIPLFVKGEVRPRMPMPVYEERFESMPWVPSGWMGNTDALTLDYDHTEIVKEGSHSIRMRYEGTYGWVGVAWQDPPNNWGDQDGGHDVSGATTLELWARGEYGGEKVTFGVGIIGSDKPHPDSAIVKSETIELSQEWTRYELDLKGEDLSSLKTGFVVTLQGRRTPVTVYLDGIRFIR